jgi:hypothetical protein
VSGDYKFSSTECQVRDIAALETYRARRTEWLRLLDGDPVHSVSNQLSAMLWNDVAYRTFNEARRFASKDDPKSAIAPILAEFLDIGYIATQLLAVAKVTESSPTDPNKSVISLRRVLDDVFANRRLITREHYVAYDGLPYDPRPVREAHYRKIMASKNAVAIEWRPTNGPEAWETSEGCHETFDRLSGVLANQRSPDDLISDDIYASMIDALEDSVFTELRLLRHKIVAHAADETNRPNELAHVTLDRLARAHRIISRVAHTLSGTILYASGTGGVPTPQFDQFEFLDQKIVETQHLDDLHEFWQKHTAERDSWLQNADEKVFSRAAGD